MQVQRKSIVFNLIFWVCFFLYEWLPNAAVSSDYYRYFFTALVYLLITAAATYFTVYGLLKNAWFKNRRFLFWAVLIASAVIFTLIGRGVNYYIIYSRYAPQAFVAQSFLFFPKLLIECVSIYLIVAAYTMIYYMQAWYEQQRISQELQKDKAEAQLELLKSQIHPHFIFNTLNNIYSLSLKQSPTTSDLIHRLSSLLSYMLYESKKKFVPLSKELEYLNNYIELEKLRYSDRLNISINIFDVTDYFKIAPFLLLPLIENSFKHGVYNSIENNWIRIDLSIHNDWLIVKIENSKSTEKENRVSENNGIGLENVKKRLEILYPGKHEFKILDDDHTFLTILKVKNTGIHAMSYSG